MCFSGVVGHDYEAFESVTSHSESCGQCRQRERASEVAVAVVSECCQPNDQCLSHDEYKEYGRRNSGLSA